VENHVRILAVDDDPIILELLRQFVESTTDHALVTVSSAADARSVIAGSTDGSFDCFLLDIQMPETDGIELCRHLRKTDTNTPVVMLTAMNERSYIDRAFRAGATDYVTKPFEVYELAARLTAAEALVAVNRQAATVSVPTARKTGVAIDHPIELNDPLTIYDVEGVIEHSALENYLQQLGRSALFGSTAFAFSIREIAAYHARMSPFEFHCMITDVAEIMADALSHRSALMSYVGSGSFACVAEKGWRPDSKQLAGRVNYALAMSELYLNSGERIEPRVCGGDAVRMIWRSGTATLDALGEAVASAERETVDREKYLDDFWYMGQSA